MRVGRRRWARAGAATTALGLSAALAVGTRVAGIPCFTLMGIGLTAVFPLALLAAGRDAARTGPELAAVSTLGYTGFLHGPPLIGVLAEASGLAGALRGRARAGAAVETA
jgi:hypothetical protein